MTHYATHRYYVWHNCLFCPFFGSMRGINAKNSPILGSFCLKGFEFVCKPSSVVYGHLSRLTVTDKLKRYSRYSVGRTALLTDTQSCCGWGLHSIPCYQSIGELLPRLSILTAKAAVYFCCTVPGVASGGRYPLSCPMKPGLSSR